MTDFKMVQINGVRWIQLGENVYVDQDGALLLTPMKRIPICVMSMTELPQ